MMPPVLSVTMGSLNTASYGGPSCLRPLLNQKSPYKCSKLFQSVLLKRSCVSSRIFVSGNAQMENSSPLDVVANDGDGPTSLEPNGQTQRSDDWTTARDYRASGLVCKGRVKAFNSGGLLVGFNSLLGFLPFPQLSPSHSCKEPYKSIREIAEGLIGSLISFKIVQADEDSRKLIFSEKEAAWSMFSEQVSVGDIFEARVGSVEDYGAFVHLRFPDGLYHLTGLVHASEVSWDLVHDVRDILNEGDEVRVKILTLNRTRLRIELSIKQLEEDPLLETLDKVIPQNDTGGSSFTGMSGSRNIEPLPGLETILEELVKEDGINNVRINRQGFEKRVVSQDLQLWLSNAPPTNKKFILLARAGRQVQEIQLSTSLDQEGIKKAIQKVLERVP